jgi:NTE family protein
VQADAAESRALAFVFGGGGSRGALQAGAVRALIEVGYRPDLLVGTSAGAINAAFLGAHGVSVEALGELDAAWRRAAELDLLPSNYVWVTLRSVLRRSSNSPASRIREFFIANGITPELRFADLPGPRVIIVSSDLNTGQPVLHGTDPNDSVLDALLVSTALPPWVMPVRKQGHYLMDGAVVSALPIEPALNCGATEIVALDLTDPRDTFGQVNGFGVFINGLTYAIEQRQVDLELQVARARNVPVLHLCLNSSEAVPVWDFRCTGRLIEEGYENARRALREA